MLYHLQMITVIRGLTNYIALQEIIYILMTDLGTRFIKRVAEV